MEISNRTDGLIAPGSIYQCYHGDNVIPQTILEWQPFDYMLVKELAPFFPDIGSISEYRLTPVEGGTKLTKKVAKPTGHWIGRAMMYLVSPLFDRVMAKAFEKFKREIESDYRRHLIILEREADITREQIRDAAAASLQESSGRK